MSRARISRPKNQPASQRTRRLRLESLEGRRLLAGHLGDSLLPPEAAAGPSGPPWCVPVLESSVDEVKGKGPQGGDTQIRPFRISGGGPAPEGVPLSPGVSAPHRATGTATGLGRYTGEGTFTMGELTISETGAVTATFQGKFVFEAANGDRLATTYGDGFSGRLTGQLSADGTTVLNVKFDAFFRPDAENSTGRFRAAVGGGWRMIARSDAISLEGEPGFTAPFDYSWSGTGTLEFEK